MLFIAVTSFGATILISFESLFVSSLFWYIIVILESFVADFLLTLIFAFTTITVPSILKSL